MIIQIKLMGMLKSQSPANGQLELVAGATVQDALVALAVDQAGLQAVTVNGAIERDFSRTLHEGDELVGLPPVGGG